MTPLEREAARLLCVGFHGDDAATIETDELAELGPGGLILFARNVTDADGTRALVARVAEAIEARCGRRPFAGVDQEGGRVARLRADAVAMPSAMALGAARDPVLARAAGRALAADVRRFGCDVDFAPVLDLALRSQSRVVGTRAFGDDASRAGALGAAFVLGLRDGGVVPVLKHAPGHGATATDSHEATPELDATPARLVARDLTPFCQAVGAGATAVMLAHVVVPELGPPPATVNPRVVAFVRAALGVPVTLFTDCLQMDGIAARTGTDEIAARAIAAGADVAIVSHDVALARAAARAIARDVADGTISPERFAGALAAAERFRTEAADAGARAAADAGDGAGGEAVALAIARAAISWLRGESGGAQPLGAGDAASVVSFEGARVASAEGQGLASGARFEAPSLALALRRRRVRAELMRVPLAPDAEQHEALDLVLDGQGVRPLIVIARGARFYPAQARAIASLVASRPQAIVVCAGEPFDLEALGGARRVLCTYGDGRAEMEALADVLTGRLAATGVSPVTLPAREGS